MKRARHSSMRTTNSHLDSVQGMPPCQLPAATLTGCMAMVTSRLQAHPSCRRIPQCNLPTARQQPHRVHGDCDVSVLGAVEGHHLLEVHVIHSCMNTVGGYGMSDYIQRSPCHGATHEGQQHVCLARRVTMRSTDRVAHGCAAQGHDESGASSRRHQPRSARWSQPTCSREDDIVAGGGDAARLVLQLPNVLAHRVSTAQVPAGRQAGSRQAT